MRQAMALAAKLGFTSVIFGITLPLLSLTPFTHALIMASSLTLLLWIAGDLMVLPRFGNLVATVADAVMAFFALPAMAVQMGVLLEPTGLLPAVLTLAVAEWFFHSYLVKHNDPV